MSAVASRTEITRQMLRGGRRSLVAWAATFTALVGLYAVIWPSVRGNARWQELFSTLPVTYRALFTAGGQFDLSTPAGYLGIELMSFLGPALMAVCAITTGAAAIAGEQASSVLEITLSAPIARSRVLAERCAALLINLIILAAVTGLALWVFSLAFGMHRGVARIASAGAALGIFGFFAGSVALAAGATAGSPALARSMGALAAVASYLVNALAQVTTALKAVRPISPFYLLLGKRATAARVARRRRCIRHGGQHHRGRGRWHRVHAPRPGLSIGGGQPCAAIPHGRITVRCPGRVSSRPATA